MPKLNLLHVSPYLVPDPGLGGIPESVMSLSEALHQVGHRVTIWAGDTGRTRIQKAVQEREDSVSIKLFRTRWTLLSSLLNAPVIPELMIPKKEAVRRFDAVHVHGYWNTFTPSIAYACRASGIPLILQPRGSLVQSGQRASAKSVFQVLFRKGIVRSTSLAIALTETEKSQILRIRLSPSQIRIIPNFAPQLPRQLPPIDTAREALGIPQQADVVLFLGRLHRAKGVEELLLSFGVVKKAHPRAVLVYAGSDEGMASELEDIVKKRGLDDVIFLGPLDSHMKWLALRAADVFCLPSFYEAFPRVVLEAGLMGVPTVLSTRVELPYAASEGAVLQCEPEPHSLAETLLALLSDESLRIRLSQAIRAWVDKHFSKSAVVSLTERAYLDAMNRTVREGPRQTLSVEGYL